MNSRTGRIHGGPDSSLAEGGTRRIETPAADLVVVRRGGILYAFDNNCPHQHFTALHRGDCEAFTIRCPMHGWTFDVRTGDSTTGEGRLRTRRVHVESGEIWIMTD